MTSKAEELRDEILRKERVPVVCDYQGPEGEVHEKTWRQATKSDLDSLISASHAEGVAEGAEQERERISGVQLHGYRVELHPYYPLEISIVPTRFLLAPTKETP